MTKKELNKLYKRLDELDARAEELLFANYTEANMNEMRAVSAKKAEVEYIIKLLSDAK